MQGVKSHPMRQESSKTLILNTDLQKRVNCDFGFFFHWTPCSSNVF